MTDEPTDHDAVKRRVSPPPEPGRKIQTLALDILVQRVEVECAAELDQIVAGADPADVLWDYFMALPWQTAMPALEELYELDEALHFMSWAFFTDGQTVLFHHAQAPKDYVRLFLLHVVVTRILRPDTDPPDLQPVGS